MKRFNLILIIVLLFSLFSLFSSSLPQTFAQDITDYDLPSIPSQVPGLEEQISINVLPENPAPNESFSINLEAYGTDLNRANISWLVNGKVVKNGVGVTGIDLVAGNRGSVSNITIIILPINGTKITKELTISPANVDITWESDSYVPPFYKGKNLYPPDSNMIFVALPNLVRNGVPIDPKTLIYKWTENDSVLADQSGYGKNVFYFFSNVLDQAVTIKVEASTVDNKIIGEGSISLASMEPRILFYENSPLYGVLFNNALENSHDLKSDEVTLSAFPYYFSTPTPFSTSIKYEWSINGAPTLLPNQQNSVLFRKPDDTTGSSIVTLEVSDINNFLQSARKDLLVNFSAKKSGNASF